MPVDQPLFSIIIPAYNYAHVLERAVKSVALQKQDDMEVFVVNDGSTDNTADVIRELEDRFPGTFKSIHQTNRGLAGTRNRGIDESSGRFLMFLDADDELAEGAMDHLRAALQKSPAAEMIIGAHLSVEPDGKERFRPRPVLSGSKKEAFKAYLLDETLPIANGCTAMSRKIFETYRYPEHLRCVEDIPMFAYVLANFSCVTLNQPIARIHKHANSMRHDVKLELNVGVSVVDEVFVEGRIPSELMHFKSDYLTHRHLSIFRTLYLAGQYRAALEYYQQAVQHSWKALLQISPLRKAIKAFFKK